MEFDNVVFTGGRAFNGGGIGVIKSSLNISRSEFTGNGLSVSGTTSLQGSAAYFDLSAINVSFFGCDPDSCLRFWIVVFTRTGFIF